MSDNGSKHPVSPDSGDSGDSGDAGTARDTGAGTAPGGPSDTALSDAARADEPRAREVIRGEVPADQLDPQTIAQLAAWFGEPATSFDASNSPESGNANAPSSRARRIPFFGQPVAENPLAPPPFVGLESDPGFAARQEQRKRAEQAVDPALLARLEARTHVGDSFIKLPEPMTLPVENHRISHIDPDVWRFHSVELRDRERPDDIVDGLRDIAPQALLRDLHRPVNTWKLLLLSRDLGVDIGGMRSSKEIQAAMAPENRTLMRDQMLASTGAYQSMDALRAHLEEPWDEIEIPEERRTHTSGARTPEDMMWFGSVGYDPDL